MKTLSFCFADALLNKKKMTTARMMDSSAKTPNKLADFSRISGIFQLIYPLQRLQVKHMTCFIQRYFNTQPTRFARISTVSSHCLNYLKRLLFPSKILRCPSSLPHLPPSILHLPPSAPPKNNVRPR